jgi:hypothetical protein
MSSGGTGRFVPVAKFRRLRDHDDRFWDNNPRWQTVVTKAFMGRVAGSQRFSAPTRARLELAVARMLGQPLSLRAWDRMTFNDKVTYRRLRVRDPKLVVFSDKLRMREYVTERLGDEAVPRLLEVGHEAEAFSDLVGPFALKANHGSNWVILVSEPRVLTEEEKRRARSWLGVDYGATWREWAYCSARRMLYAEELLGSAPPPDFKFFTFEGRPEVVQVDVDRFSSHQRLLLSPEWEPLGTLAYPPPPQPPGRPPNLSQMLEWASILAEGTDFLRVDLYDLGDRVLVGELTCYPESGQGRFRPERLDQWLGNKWTTKPG